MKKFLLIFLLLSMMGCHRNVVPVNKSCPNPAQSPVFIPEDWTIQWLGINAKAIVEAYKIQQETIRCYEKIN